MSKFRQPKHLGSIHINGFPLRLTPQPHLPKIVTTASIPKFFYCLVGTGQGCVPIACASGTSSRLHLDPTAHYLRANGYEPQRLPAPRHASDDLVWIEGIQEYHMGG